MSEHSAAVYDILVDELAEVTPAMIDAGSAALLEADTVVDHQGRRQPRMTTEAARLAAVWRAMLAAKLDSPSRAAATVYRHQQPVPDIGDRG